MEIQLMNVSKRYEDKMIFENINIIIKQGDFIIIKGKSGSGKTTLGNIIGGIDKPTSGKVKYNPQENNL